MYLQCSHYSREVFPSGGSLGVGLGVLAAMGQSLGLRKE